MPSGPLVRLVLTFGPDTLKSERYKDGIAWYKAVLEEGTGQIQDLYRPPRLEKSEPNPKREWVRISCLY